MEMVLLVIIAFIIGWFLSSNGGLVEGDIPDICRGKMDKVCEVERKVGFGTCSGCISPIAAQLLKDCKFDNFIEYCKNLPEPPPPPGNDLDKNGCPKSNPECSPNKAPCSLHCVVGNYLDMVKKLCDNHPKLSKIQPFENICKQVEL